MANLSLGVEIVLLISILYLYSKYLKYYKKYGEEKRKNIKYLNENETLRSDIKALKEMNDNISEKYGKAREKLNMIEKQVSKLPADYQNLIKVGE